MEMKNNNSTDSQSNNSVNTNNSNTSNNNNNGTLFKDANNMNFIKRNRDTIIDFMSGIVGGCSGILAGHPLDTVKVRLQGESNEYRGMVHCITRIVKEEGPTGLYKGMASPLFGVAAINSLLFSVYGVMLKVFNDYSKASNIEKPDISVVAAAGTASGLVNAFICAPTELVKIRLQNQKDAKQIPTGHPIYNGPIDCCKQIYAKNGTLGFFRGLTSTIVRETPSYGAYFATFEYLSRKLVPEEELTGDIPSPRLLVAGGFAGIVAWIVTYPADVIKTRLQSVEQEVKPKYKGFFDCWKSIVRNEGHAVLWRGLGATCIRAFPTNGSVFYGVCTAKSLLYGATDRFYDPEDDDD